MHRGHLCKVATLLALAVFMAACSGDCAWNAEFRTWIDENENGVWDAEEPPLPDVKILIESPVLVAPEVISDEAGQAQFHAALGGCPRDAVFFVYVLPPPGYRPSISTLYPTEEHMGRAFDFGFVFE